MGASPQPTEIAWELIGTTRGSTTESLAKQPPKGCTLALFKWEPSSLPEGATRRLIYYKFVVTFAPLTTSWLGRPNQHFEQLFDDFTKELRIAVLQARLTASSGMAYFTDASPRQRTVTETADGTMRVSTGDSNAVSVGKSLETLHDVTTTNVTTTTDPGATFGVDLGGLSFGFSGDTTQTHTTSVDHNSSNRMDVTQRDASTERSELYSFTTRLSNVLSTLSCGHLGSPDLRFTLWAPPVHTMPDVGQDAASAKYLKALRRKSSGLEGVQEFFAVASAELGARVCIETRLDTVYLTDLGKPLDWDTKPIWWPIGQVPEQDIKLGLDYLKAKYPLGTPIDKLNLDVDVIDLGYLSEEHRDRLRVGSIGGWYWDFSEHQFGVWVEYFLSKPEAGASPKYEFHTRYKPLHAVLLEAKRAQRDRLYAWNPLTFPIVNSLSVKCCDASIAETASHLHVADLDSISFEITKGGLEAKIADSIASMSVDELKAPDLTHPAIREALMTIAAERNSDLDVHSAVELGFPEAAVRAARDAGINTLGKFALALFEREARDELERRRVQAKATRQEVDTVPMPLIRLLRPINRIVEHLTKVLGRLQDKLKRVQYEVETTRREDDGPPRPTNHPIRSSDPITDDVVKLLRRNRSRTGK